MKAVIARSLYAVLVLSIPIGAAHSLAEAQSWPNEPSGSTLVTDWSFPSITGSGWGGLASPYEAIITDPTAKVSPQTALQITFPTGFGGGASPASVGYEHPEIIGTVRELYVGLWWKVSNPWQGHNSGVNKILYLTQAWGTCGPSQQQQVLTMFGTNAPASTGPFRLRFTNEFVSIAASYNLEPNVNNPPVELGTWHQLEFYRKLSSTTSSQDGILRWWMDGTLVGNYTTINDSQCPFLGLYLAPTWGGVADVKTETDYYWYNRVRISLPNGSSLATPTGLTVR
jgi:hypothetical protein